MRDPRDSAAIGYDIDTLAFLDPQLRHVAGVEKDRVIRPCRRRQRANEAAVVNMHHAAAQQAKPARRLRARGSVRFQVGDHVGCREIEAVLLRSEEHTSELQSLMRISYAVFCLKKKKRDALQMEIDSNII